MTKPQFVHSPEDCRKLLQQQNSQLPRRINRIGEVAGATTAEMAAVCCCFPCAVVDFMVLTMYKVPAGLWRRRRRRRLTMGGGGRRSYGGDGEVAAVERFVPAEVDDDLVAFENEMWEMFSGTGFWRSPSCAGNIVVSREIDNNCTQ